MGLGKWIGGIVGFMTMGPLGALAGYALGSMLESGDSLSGEGVNGGYGSAGTVHGEMYGERNSFLFSMLVMASYIIQADGKIMHSEMEFVRKVLRQNFGEQGAEEGNQILLNLFEHRKQMDERNPYAFQNTIRECGMQMAESMVHEERLQILDFLVQIAQSDGHISPEEIEALKEVAQSMGLSVKEVESMLHLGGNTLEDAYKVLEIEPTATDAEVKAAYRKLALKHHPDRVATLGEDIRKAAQEKFQQVNNAKEQIYKSRGLK